MHHGNSVTQSGAQKKPALLQLRKTVVEQWKYYKCCAQHQTYKKSRVLSLQKAGIQTNKFTKNSVSEITYSFGLLQSRNLICGACTQ